MSLLRGLFGPEKMNVRWSSVAEVREAILSGDITRIGRRMITGSMAAWLLRPVLGQAAPPGVERRSVRIQLDDGALQTIPGDEQADVTIEEDNSATAQTLIKETPPGRAVPIIYMVVGILSIPVIWDTVREMLRREYYGGIVIDARQTPALITHDKTLPAELVLFIGADGKSQRYEARNVPEDLLTKLAKVR
jgi:hypothetical protein